MDKNIITATKLMENGLWEKFCKIRGWSVYVVSEGLFDSNEDLELSLAELIDLTL